MSSVAVVLLVSAIAAAIAAGLDCSQPSAMISSACQTPATKVLQPQQKKDGTCPNKAGKLLVCPIDGPHICCTGQSAGFCCPQGTTCGVDPKSGVRCFKSVAAAKKAAQALGSKVALPANEAAPPQLPKNEEKKEPKSTAKQNKPPRRRRRRRRNNRRRTQKNQPKKQTKKKEKKKAASKKKEKKKKKKKKALMKKLLKKEGPSIRDIIRDAEREDDCCCCRQSSSCCKKRKRKRKTRKIVKLKHPEQDLLMNSNRILKIEKLIPDVKVPKKAVGVNKMVKKISKKMRKTVKKKFKKLKKRKKRVKKEKKRLKKRIQKKVRAIKSYERKMSKVNKLRIESALRKAEK